MSRLFSFYSRHYHDWAERKGQPDPRWQAVDTGKGSVFDWFEQHKIESELVDKPFPHPWWFYRLPLKAHWWLDKHGPKQKWYDFRHFVQRGRKGYSVFDTFGFDGYLCRVIANGLDDIRSVAHGWPGEPLTFEQWLWILEDISNGFRANQKMMWGHSEPDYNEDALWAEFNRGMDLFRFFFNSLWD